ncbi:MAG: repeat protein [Bacteroidota bacterium]|nr:repeat protein [Bacteroidota bacterium]
MHTLKIQNSKMKFCLVIVLILIFSNSYSDSISQIITNNKGIVIQNTGKNNSISARIFNINKKYTVYKNSGPVKILKLKVVANTTSKIYIDNIYKGIVGIDTPKVINLNVGQTKIRLESIFYKDPKLTFEYLYNARREDLGSEIYFVVTYPISKDFRSVHLTPYGKYGYLNIKTNELPIKCNYDQIGEFTHGLAIVAINNTYGVINEFGTFIMDCKYNHIDFPPRYTDEQFIISSIKNKYGLFDQDGKELIAPRYDMLSNLNSNNYHNNGHAKIEIDGLYGLIDMQGNELLKPMYSYISDFNGAYAKIAIGGTTHLVSGKQDVKDEEKQVGAKWGLVNSLGQIILQPKYDKIIFENEPIFMGYGPRFITKLNGKWHFVMNRNSYLNTSDPIYISLPASMISMLDTEFDDIGESKNLGNIVKKNGKYGLVDFDGHYLLPCIYEKLEEDGYEENYYSVYENKKCGLFKVQPWDIKIDTIVPIRYDYVFNISKNICGIWQNDKLAIYNYYDKVQAILQYDDINYAQGDNLIMVSKNGKGGFLNSTGKEVTSFIYDYDDEKSNYYTYGNYTITLKGGKYVLLTSKGKELFNEPYDDMDFNNENYNNLILLKKDDKFTFYNFQSDSFFDTGFDYADLFKKGISITKVKLNGKFGVVNSNGRIILPCFYNTIEIFSNSMLSAEKNNVISYFNSVGECILNCRSIGK